MITFTDTHCHLNDPAFDGRVGEVLARAAAVGVTEVIVPGWDRESSLRAVELAAEFPAIRAAVGLHPWFVTENDDLSWLPPLLDDPRVVAVGEIGLDGAIENDDPEKQEMVFRAQLTLAAEHQLPVLVHCRRRWDRLLPCLRELPSCGIMHAFSGSVETMRLLLALGFYISFTGSVTRPNAKRVHQAAAAVPADRLLVETDAPAIGLETVPAEQVGPDCIPAVLAAIARLHSDPLDVLAWQVAGNLRALLTP
ncbi:MAG: TatD family hydrolase [Armatimonadota bacterium]